MSTILERQNNTIVSVVIPVFRNSGTLVKLHSEITSTALHNFPQLTLEIIFIDDGSDDNSWDIIIELVNKDPQHVSAHKLSRNFGQLSAMLAGYQRANGNCLISISADLQDPPNLIGEMVNRWLQGDDIVIANRKSRDDGFLAKITSWIAYSIARRFTPGLPKGGFDYFLMSRTAIDLLLKFKGRFRFIQGDLLWLGLPTSFIPYDREKRLLGVSGYSMSKRFSNFLNLVLDGSQSLIKVMTKFGLLVIFFGFLYLISIVYTWWTGGTPFEGWAPIMVAILVLNGILLIMLGILGSYLWRIYDLIRERPMNVILSSEIPKKQ
jgi:glycosyltransferase involved in cell wall biosynthesis